MEKQSMPNSTSLIQVIKPPISLAEQIKQAADKATEAFENLLKALDPDYPSVIVSPPPDGIDSPSLELVEKVRPDFIRKDNEGWG